MYDFRMFSCEEVNDVWHPDSKDPRLLSHVYSFEEIQHMWSEVVIISVFAYTALV